MEEDLKEKIAPFVNDPNWKFVESLIYSEIDSLLNFTDIDLTQDGADVKGEMKARKKIAETVKKSLSKLLNFKYREPIKLPSFK